MNILLKWNFRTLRANLPRLCLTLLSIAGSFAVLTAMGLMIDSHMENTGAMNGGLPQFVLRLLRPLTLAVFCPERVAPRWALLSMVASTAVAVLFSTALSAPVHPLFLGLAVSAGLLAPGLRFFARDPIEREGELRRKY